MPVTFLCWLEICPTSWYTMQIGYYMLHVLQMQNYFEERYNYVFEYHSMKRQRPVQFKSALMEVKHLPISQRNVMTINDLANQGARASETMVLSWHVILRNACRQVWGEKKPPHHQTWNLWGYSLKTQSYHNANFFVTGGTRGCDNWKPKVVIILSLSSQVVF